MTEKRFFALYGVGTTESPNANGSTNVCLHPIFMKVIARNEEEALGWGFKYAQVNHPEVNIRRMTAEDITEVARNALYDINTGKIDEPHEIAGVSGFEEPKRTQST